MLSDLLSLGAASRESGVGGLREGQPTDAAPGVLPALVARPQSVEEVSRLLAWANGRGLKVVPCGSRTKLDRGAPPARCDLLLDLSALSGVVEHAAGDLTVTVKAGTPLAELQAALSGAGQFLAVDPPIPGSVGGLLATADSGPRRLRYGGVRDLVLGVTFVRADGVVAKAGGRVVKNVAGYDLTRLFTGSLGTLGVIVEATFRLYPLPAASATVLVEGVSPTEAARLALGVQEAGLAPTSLDYFAPETGNGGGIFAARFEGSAGAAQAQADRAAQVAVSAGGGAVSLPDGEADARFWGWLPGMAATGEGDALGRVVVPRAALAGLLERAARESASRGMAVATWAHMGHGHALLRAAAPGDGSALEWLHAVRAEAERHGGALAVWRASPGVRASFDVWGNPGEGLGLMRRVKAQFDPNNTLNPGRFAGGI